MAVRVAEKRREVKMEREGNTSQDHLVFLFPRGRILDHYGVVDLAETHGHEVVIEP